MLTNMFYTDVCVVHMSSINVSSVFVIFICLFDFICSFQLPFTSFPVRNIFVTFNSNPMHLKMIKITMIRLHMSIIWQRLILISS